MRKRNILLLADTIFWYLIYFLPVILYGIYLIHGSESASYMDFASFLAANNLSIVSVSNPVYIAFNSLFGAEGVLPLFDTAALNPAIFITCWFCGTFILHLAVDFLLFIPRLAHKWMDGFTKGKEC